MATTLSFLLWPSLLLLLHLLISSSSSSGENENTDDAIALLSLKSFFNDTGRHLSSWTNESDPCAENKIWKGIVCYNGAVTGLHLRRLNISGRIDIDSLSRLPLLRSISIVGNTFPGNIPNFGKLNGLKSMYFSHNLFNGRIPDDLFENLTHLKKLWLSENSFTGPIPSSISKLMALMELHLENNQLDGNLPEVFLPGLKFFNVSNNLLRGAIPHNFQKFGEEAFVGNPGLCGPPFVDRPCAKPYFYDENNSSTDPYSKRKTIALMILISTLFVIFAGMILIKKRKMDEDFRGLDHDYEESVYSKRQKWKNLRDPYFSMDRRTAKRKGSLRTGSSRAWSSSSDLVVVNREKGVFTMSDLMKAAAEVIGSGGLGSAYKAVLGNESTTVVVKRMRQMNMLVKDEFDLEVRRMGEMRHPNVLTPLAYHYRKEEKLLVFKYIDKGSVLYLLHGDRGPNHDALDSRKRLRIIQGIADGMVHLHEELADLDVPHGNLKSGNVLLHTDEYVPMLIDYGYTPLISNELAEHVMFAYRSPEYLRIGKVSPKSDVYCLGIIMLEILTGKFPSQYLSSGKGGTDLVEWVNSAGLEGNEADLIDPEIVRGVDTSVKGTMVRMLRVAATFTDPNPNRRPHMKDAKRRIEEAMEEPLVTIELFGRGGGADREDKQP